MMTHIKMVHWILEIAGKNVEEAERYAKKAHLLRDEHRAAADWCVEMARRHLEFNEKGCTMLTQLCREMEQTMAENELYKMMKTYVTETRAHLAKETAEVKLLLEMYER